MSDRFFRHPPGLDLAALLALNRERDRLEMLRALAQAPAPSVLALSPDLAESVGALLATQWVVDRNLVSCSWEVRRLAERN